MKIAKVSVIIPCYNDGEYLQEAVESVERCDKGSYEIIVIDDGSTDKNTIEAIDNIGKNGHKIFRIEHAGQSSARNFGAKQAQYDYLLFLDADNRIYPEYLHEGARILDENPEVGAVYGDKNFFGLENCTVIQHDFDLHEAFFVVIFDMCCVIRKKLWEDCGGLDEKMDFYEDWEFFMNAAKLGWKFFHIKKAMFDYRIKPESVNSKRFEKSNRLRIMSYIYKKHFDFFVETMDDIVGKYGLKGKIHILETIAEQERNLAEIERQKNQALQTDNQALVENLEKTQNDTIFLRDALERSEEREEILIREKAELAKIKTAFDEIEKSITWSLAKKVHKLIDALIPQKSLVGKLYCKALLKVRKILKFQ